MKRFFQEWGARLWVAAFLMLPAGAYGVARRLHRAPPSVPTARTVAPAQVAGPAVAPALPEGDPLGFLAELQAARRPEAFSPAEARSLLQSGAFSRHRTEDLLRRWAIDDPKGALDWVAPQAGRFHELVEEMMTAFFQRDPLGALEAFRATHGMDWFPVAAAMIWALLTADPAIAAEIESALDRNFELYSTDDLLGKREGDRVALARKVAALPAGRVRRQLLEALPFR